MVRRLNGLYDAIADGIRTPGLKDRLEELEARRADLDAELAAPPPTSVRLHPNLSAMYRRKVEQLSQTLSDPEIRPMAIEAKNSNRPDAACGLPRKMWIFAIIPTDPPGRRKIDRHEASRFQPSGEPGRGSRYARSARADPAGDGAVIRAA